jgi:hypothetical protein
MLAAALFFELAISQTLPAKLAYENGGFTVSIPGREERIASSPLEPPKGPVATPVFYRKDATFAAWDARGLTIRVGEKVTSTRLSSFLLDPLLNSPAEIAKHRFLIQAGRMKSGAADLVAARRFKHETLWVVRWQELDGKQVADALVAVDLGAANPEPKVVAKLKGRLIADGPITSRLLALADKVTLIEANETRWGIVQWDPVAKRLSRSGMGHTLRAVEMISNRLGAFVESTPRGTQVLGRLDLVSKGRKDLLETPGEAMLLDRATPWIAYVIEGGEARLHNLDSGAKMTIPADSYAKRGAKSLLIWSGGSHPSAAALYDWVRWDKLANWVAPKTPPATNPKPETSKPDSSKPKPKPTAKPPAQPAPAKPKPKKPEIRRNAP